MRLYSETIVAPITGIQPAAVAILRICGPDAFKIGRKVFAALPENPTPKMALVGSFITGDDGFVLPFEEGKSFTGDETVELNCHGGRAAVSALLDACVAAGARLAKPGEFTQRAFLNGKLDLSQAEAVRETVDAETSLQLRYANLMRDGHLRNEVAALRAEAMRMLTLVDLTTDFSEEIGELNLETMAKDAATLSQGLQALIDRGEHGALLRNGLRIAIVGAPNVGKSTLLNYLVGAERSIVTEIAGTTRDYVEETVSLQGLPVVFIDTAGLRETEDVVESIGIQRSRLQASNADQVWFLYDAEKGWSPEDENLLQSLGRKAAILANKSDLASKPESGKGFPISAKTGAGLADALREMIPQLATLQSPSVSPNPRHVSHLQEASESLKELEAAAYAHFPSDLLAVYLQTVIFQLGFITGETADEEILESIFSQFCLGK